MTQPQAQQFTYSRRFSELISQIDQRDTPRIWSIAHREGLEAAIAWCENLLRDKEILEKYQRNEH
jgi:predicted 3-demethylubiquinone-9 3-methyltransferase (glyoxalase superfamily)